MAAYSEWRQDPDYLQWYTIMGDGEAGVDPIDGQPLFGYGPGVISVETGFQYPRYPITILDLEQTTRGVTEPNQNWAGIGGFRGYSTWSTSYTWGYQLSIQEGVSKWNSSWEAESVTRWFRIRGRDYFYNPINYGVPVPEGAIGIDWEGQPYDPGDPWSSGPTEIQTRGISNEAPTVLRGDWGDTSDPAVVPASMTTVWFQPDALGAEPGTLVTIPPPLTPTDFANAGSTTLPEPIDLTDLIKDAGWSGRLWTKHAWWATGADLDGGTALSNGGIVNYGWGFDDIRIDTMVRPARYRWVFASDPPRRTYPRDDGLAGGAPRVWPSSKAVQSSARILGPGSIV